MFLKGKAGYGFKTRWGGKSPRFALRAWGFGVFVAVVVTNWDLWWDGMKGRRVWAAALLVWLLRVD
jgi:hypothetical protein